MTQVVIIGAGPTGATLALLLLKRGISVTLIEASRSFQRAFRGEGLMPSGLDALEQMGLLPTLEQIPHRALDAWEFIVNQRSLFRVDEPLEPGGKSCTLVSQSAFLDALIDEASTYPQFEFVQGTPVQELLWSSGANRALSTSGEPNSPDRRVAGVRVGDRREWLADLVIGADGRNSILRQCASLPFTQQSQRFDILWFKLADSPQFQSENIFYSLVNKGHALGVFRSSEGNLQIGWSLHGQTATNWKEIDWVTTLASVSPPWLADHVQTHAASLERPVFLSVVVGRCPRWSVPGLLLLGDAAHPMSPIRAQGINMALRDVVVAANHLVPLLQQAAERAEIDAVLPQIQREREPEIVRAQQLQAEEMAQGELLINYPLLRWAASQFAPLIRHRVRQSWRDRQYQLRQGLTQIQLSV